MSTLDDEVLGCNPCGTRWAPEVGPNCWMCGTPGTGVLMRIVTHTCGDAGPCAEMARVARNTMTAFSGGADPCGGGPIR